MVVYLETVKDWETFVSGQWVIASKKPLKQYFRAIIVSPIEMIDEDDISVIIEKKY